MKKVWLAVALIALCGLAANSFADVQNIRLSGDIRIVGYYLNRVDENQNQDSSFVSQRTRVCVEADLEDHVLVVVTLQAEGLWGSDSETSSTSGAGGGFSSSVNRRWDVGVAEAYVQLNELFYSPATLKIGRQYLNYGHGLILSSAQQEYNFDAGRLVLDYYPLTIDLVGAQVVNNQSFGASSSHAGSADLLFINARYEMTDSLLKNIEAYFGWLAQGSSGPISSGRVPPSFGGASPMIIGLRSDMNLTDGLSTWIEGAYEFGADGTISSSRISAFLANAGLKFSKKDSKWSLNANYTFADGGGGNGNHDFRPWFDYADGYNGYLFSPALVNLNIFNLGASVKLYENASLSLQGYYYYKVDGKGPIGSNRNVDFGGPEFAPVELEGSGKDVGLELDSIFGYDYSKDVRFQLVYGVFFPSSQWNDENKVAHEVRAELDVKF